MHRAGFAVVEDVYLTALQQLKLEKNCATKA
jgi:hypothetical protein